MVINHNMLAINTTNALGRTSGTQAKSMEKLSSGLRINRAGDDAAGLAISEKMRGQIKGLNQASRNAQDGISMIQTAEGALTETHSILQRMRELAVQGSNDTLVDADRSEIQKEISQLNSEIDRISDTTEFNTQKLLNGSLGAKGTSSNEAAVEIKSVSGLEVGDYTVNVTTVATKAKAADGSLDLTATGNNFASKDLKINGIDITFENGMADHEVIAKINSYSDETGVTASLSGTKVSLEQNEYGSAKTLTIAGGDAAQFGQAVTPGADAVATVTSGTVVTTVTGVGQALNYEGAEFTATATAPGSSTVSVSSSGASIHIGANKDQTMSVDINQMSTDTLGNGTDKIKDVNVLTAEGAEKAIKTVDDAIRQVSSERSKLGAFQNRLEHTNNNLNTSSENLQAAESRIRDVDMAKEMVQLTKNNILQQAAQSMLAQANQAPQGVLGLLR